MKDPLDDSLAQASTHDRFRTAERHSAARSVTCPRTRTLSSLSCPVASRTRPMGAAHPRLQALPPGTQDVVSTPAVRSCSMSAPCMQARPSMYALCACRAGPGNRVFCTRQPCDPGNKVVASTHGMRSGGLSVDAMAIGCLGVERRGERFFHTNAIFRLRLQGVCLLLQDLLQSCSRGRRRRVEDICYERRRAEACVDESAHHALANAGGREIV